MYSSGVLAQIIHVQLPVIMNNDAIAQACTATRVHEVALCTLLQIAFLDTPRRRIWPETRTRAMSEEEVQKSSDPEEVGPEQPHEGPEGQGAPHEGEGEAPSHGDAEPEGATAYECEAPSAGPQPPYDEDFNPFTEEGACTYIHLCIQ